MAEAERSRLVEYEGKPTGGRVGMNVPLEEGHPKGGTNWKLWARDTLVGALVVGAALIWDRTRIKTTSGPVLTVTSEPMSAAFPSTSSSYAIYNPIGMTPPKTAG